MILYHNFEYNMRLSEKKGSKIETQSLAYVISYNYIFCNIKRMSLFKKNYYETIKQQGSNF
jgi:hypothetical protein